MAEESKERGGAHVRQASRTVTSVMYDLAMENEDGFDDNHLGVHDYRRGSKSGGKSGKNMHVSPLGALNEVDDDKGTEKYAKAREFGLQRSNSAIGPPSGKGTLMAGYLKKQGGFKGGFKNWRARYFVLKEDFLSYYKTDPTGANPTRSKSVVDLFQITTPSKDNADGATKNLYGVMPLKGSQVINVIASNELLSPAETQILFDPEQRRAVTVLKIDRPTALKRYDAIKSWVGKGQDFLFGMKMEGRLLWLSAPSQENKAAWIRALSSAIDAANNMSTLNVPTRTLHKRLSSFSLSGVSANGIPTEVHDWEIPFKAMKFGDKIGDGNFGEVFVGKLWGTQVALKTLKINEMKAEEIIEDLKNEVEILARLRHPNVVLYVGAATQYPDVCIVTEWCENKSLHDIIYDGSMTMNMPLMLEMAIDIAQGMNYLHSLEPPIIHRDLKSHNVLLDKKFSAKVADFGLSYKAETYKDTEGEVIGTPEWMAPEVMEGKPYDNKVDVYSFGIVLTELFSRRRPFSDQYVFYGYMDVFEAVLYDNAVPTMPDWIGSHLKKLILRCLSRSPARRPSFSSIISELRGLTYRDPTQGLFVRYDTPRLLEMLYSKNAKVQTLAAKEIAQLQKRSRLHFQCSVCGHTHGSNNENLFGMDAKTLSVIVVRLTGLFGSTEDRVVYHSTRAFSEVLKMSTPEQISSYRGLLREDGSLRKILVFLNSTDPDIKRNSAEIMSMLTTGLSPEETTKFVDLTPAGLNELSAIQGGHRGLERLLDVANIELDELTLKREQLDAQILQRIGFTETLQKSVEILGGDLQEHKMELKRVSSRAKGTNKQSETDCTTGPSQQLFKRDSVRRLVNYQCRSFTQSPADESEVGNHNNEIASSSGATFDFLRFFGNGSHFEANCMVWHPSSTDWDFGYLFCHDLNLHIYVSREDDPQDPVVSLNLTDETRVKKTGWAGMVDCLVLEHLKGTFILAFRVPEEAFRFLDYTHMQLSSIKEIKYPGLNRFSVARNELQTEELKHWISQDLKDRFMDVLLETADELVTIESLPEAISRFFDSNSVQHYGTMMMTTGSDAPWFPLFCIQVNGVFHTYDSLDASPASPLYKINVGQDKRDSEFCIVFNDSNPQSVWDSRSLALYDGTSLFLFCLPTTLQRTQWIEAINH